MAKVLAPVAISSSTGQHHSALSAGAEGSEWIDSRPNAWIQYDLGSIVNVGAVNIGFGAGADLGAKIRYTFNVQASPDGLSYTNVLSNKRNSVIKKTKYPFKSRAARYVRLTIVSNNDATDPYRAAVDVFEVETAGKPLKPVKKPKKVKSKTKRRIR